MHLSDEDFLKKAILDTQEKVRDFEQYSRTVKDEELRDCFSEFAEHEGHQASQLQELLKSKFSKK